MKKRICSLILLAVFLCSILTACGGSSQPSAPVSGPGNSQTAGTSQKNVISVRLDSIAPLSYTTGSGDRIYTSNGYYWDTTYHYELRLELTIINSGDVTSNIDKTLFNAYWDDEELAFKSISFDGTTDSKIKLAPKEQTTVHLVYSMNKYQYENWNVPGHSAKFVIRYAGDSLTYTYLTETGEVKMS